MGTFHCIPQGCGRVLYQEYLPPKVRWRYPEEEWQEIEGDSYEVDNRPAQCCGTWDITVEYNVPGCNGGINYIGEGTVRIPYGTYRRIEYRTDNPFVRTVLQVVYYDCHQDREKELSFWSSTGKSSTIPDCGDPLAIHDKPGSTYRIVDAVRVDDGIEECNTCFFTVYRNGEIVHAESREDCPEVEQLPCRLSDVVREVEIDKAPYLQRIEVRDHGVGYLPIGAPLYQRYEIPNECLNIYNTNVWAAPIVLDTVPAPGALNPFIFVKQICSAPGCPPPEYNVICDCDCEKCPAGTCPKECGNHVCCYDSTGKVVKEIEIEKYCGDEI